VVFQARYKCSDCGHGFDKTTKHDPRKGGRKPSCPECKKGKQSAIKSISKSNVIHTQEQLDKNVQAINESRQAPSMGKSNFTKAMDATADIVMKDYNMTNLQDNLRAGDSMAPKLRPELESQVDNVFKPQKPIMGQKTAGSINNALTAQINSGRYAGQSKIRDVAAQAREFGQARTNATGYKVPTDIILDNNRIPN
jgi:hypothetical protein